MSQPYYETDLTDAEWARIEPLLPPEKPVGKEREVDLRVVLNGVFYRADNGIKWRALPPEFGAWQTVYGYFRLWVRLGIWEQINVALVRQVRLAAGREADAIFSRVRHLIHPKFGHTITLNFGRYRTINSDCE